MSTKTRIYVGNLSSRTREKDLDDAFYKFGKILRVDMKNGFAFIEFDDDRDADDAIYKMNGEDIDGRRITVELSKGGRGGGGGAGAPPRGGRGGGHRLEAEGLDSRVSWQDLKDFARQAGDVAYTDVWVDRGEKKGVIEYSRKSDMEEALSTLHDTKLEKHNCYIKLYKPRDDSRSASRSRSRGRKERSRSRSPKKSDRKASKSPKRKRSTSPRKRSTSPRKRSASPKRRSASRSRS